MRLLQQVSPRAIGISAALVTVVMWTSFIVVTGASSGPTRGLPPLPLAATAGAGVFGVCSTVVPVGQQAAVPAAAARSTG